MAGAQKIIDGLRDAVQGNFTRVTIEGQTWAREGDDKPSLTWQLDPIKPAYSAVPTSCYPDGTSRPGGCFGYIEPLGLAEAERVAAAAPDLLEAVKVLLRSADFSNHWAGQVARAALAKVEGR